ncbi:MAG: hypothetical protein COA57_06300 [Flavobacteriales bacterium]|nr:hotdog fold thioesterase [Bacteroidales bacterium AH-315-I05]PCJ86333.1 MAG: hypothetical protein COA57_06300 [Flavobacteriales bacterium]
MQAPKELYTNIIEEVIPFNKFLGWKLLDIKDGYAKMLIPYREELLGDPRAKRWHGGVIGAAMDSVGGAAGMTTMTSYEDKMSTIDIRIDYLRGTKPENLIVEGEIMRSGNRIIATKMWAYHEGSDEIVAEARAVYNVRRKEKD